MSPAKAALIAELVPSIANPRRFALVTEDGDLIVTLSDAKAARTVANLLNVYVVDEDRETLQVEEV